MKPYILSLLVSLCVLNSVQSQTTVSGGIYSSTTWTKANSPYILQGDVVVFGGVDLNIEPGTVIKFDNNAQIVLRGNLKAIGTSTDSIYFTSNSNTPAIGDYKGIYVDVNGGVPFGQPTNQINMAYCVVSYSANFLNFRSQHNGPYQFKFCRFHHNRYVNSDFRTSGNTTSFDNCLFEDNIDCLNGGGENGALYVTNCKFINNVRGTNGGIVNHCVYIGNTVFGAYMYQQVKNSYFKGNNIGIKSDHHGNTRVEGNLIFNNNIGVEIDRMGIDPSIVFKNNKICSNTTWNVKYNFSWNVDFSDNCWCSNDSAFIRSKIRDGYQDPAYGLTKFTYDDSCSDTDTLPASLTVSNTIKSGNNETSMRLFPNPASATTTVDIIEVAEQATYDIQIVDLTGKSILVLNDVKSGKNTLNISSIDAGIYFIHLSRFGNYIATSKLIIVR
ncbi:MAG TPA: T9SS type A sorting domain-containing protein [Flavipsychrobacter sp.]|nr:T9SS type A sorting domain-containing protein [Flavipsychrobacter sp.]